MEEAVSAAGFPVYLQHHDAFQTALCLHPFSMFDGAASVYLCVFVCVYNMGYTVYCNTAKH